MQKRSPDTLPPLNPDSSFKASDWVFAVCENVEGKEVKSVAIYDYAKSKWHVLTAGLKIKYWYDL